MTYAVKQLQVLHKKFDIHESARTLLDIEKSFIFFSRLILHPLAHCENIMSKDKLLAVGERYEAMIAADRAADARYR